MKQQNLDAEGFQLVHRKNKGKGHEGFAVGHGKPKVVYRPVIKNTKVKSFNEVGGLSKINPATLVNLDDDEVNFTKQDDVTGKKGNTIEEHKAMSSIEKSFHNACGPEINITETDLRTIGKDDSDSDLENRGKTDGMKSYSEEASTAGKHGSDV